MPLTLSSWEHRRGEHVFTVPAGKTLKIETEPDGEEIFAGTVPAGKKWDINLVLDVDEENA